MPGAGVHRRAAARANGQEGWAKKLVVAELRSWRLTEDDLEGRRKGDAKKVKVAQRLRQKTTMILNSIAERLKMGKAGFLGNLIRNVKG